MDAEAFVSVLTGIFVCRYQHRFIDEPTARRLTGVGGIGLSQGHAKLGWRSLLGLSHRGVGDRGLCLALHKQKDEERTTKTLVTSALRAPLWAVCLQEGIKSPWPVWSL